MIGRSNIGSAQAFDAALSSGGRGRRAGEAGEVDTLVHTAEVLRRAAVAEPGAEFRLSLRVRLMTEAVTVLDSVPETVAAATPTVTDRTHPGRRRLVGLTAALVAGVGTVGMVSSSATAVPGDLLYPVKRGVESVHLAVQRDPASRGEFQLERASERLAEAWYLDDNDRDERVAEALDAFADEAAAGSDALFQAYDADGSSDRIDTVTDFAADSTVTLARMSDDLPDDARAAIETATTTLTGLVSQASALCASCASPDVTSLVDAVEEAVGSTEIAPSLDGPSSPPSTTSDDEVAPVPQPSSGGSAPTVPQVTPTPSLKKVTDPILGGLLGDDEQEGLVPGLLDGLLGSK